jgi:hypothetical protein
MSNQDKIIGHFVDSTLASTITKLQLTNRFGDTREYDVVYAMSPVQHQWKIGGVKVASARRKSNWYDIFSYTEYEIIQDNFNID